MQYYNNRKKIKNSNIQFIVKRPKVILTNVTLKRPTHKSPYDATEVKKDIFNNVVNMLHI